MLEGGLGCGVRLQRSGDLEVGCKLKVVRGRGAAYKVG